MALCDITGIKNLGDADGLVSELELTTFAGEGIQERAHLQAAFRDNIELLGEGLKVVSEEFSDFEGAGRRIDLLCIDKDCRLVVVELKRTADGGHMELQAIRYAAMVSTMTFDRLCTTLARYRANRKLPDATVEAARADLLDWLEVDEGEEPVLPRDVGIILAAEDFSQEITTTVLWLNEFHEFDIRCIRLQPYKLSGRLLMDIQQLIPLPEASEYTILVREKEAEKKQVGRRSVDRTKFIIKTPAGASKPLPKRWAVLELVKSVALAGVAMAEIDGALPVGKIIAIDGQFDSPQELWRAIQQEFGKSDENSARWHLADPIFQDGQTWVLNNNWGDQTRQTFRQLLAIAPDGFEVVDDI